MFRCLQQQPFCKVTHSDNMMTGIAFLTRHLRAVSSKNPFCFSTNTAPSPQYHTTVNHSFKQFSTLPNLAFFFFALLFLRTWNTLCLQSHTEENSRQATGSHVRQMLYECLHKKMCCPEALPHKPEQMV